MDEGGIIAAYQLVAAGRDEFVFCHVTWISRAGCFRPDSSEPARTFKKECTIRFGSAPMSWMSVERSPEIAVVGGGAAGFFAAIACAGTSSARVTIYEAGRRPLEKVRISGGGRCNVTHACFDPARLIEQYPRGARALRGPFSRFGPRDTIDWFESRGVPLKTEADGRVFPTSDQSGSIIDCLRRAATAAGVLLRTSTPIQKARATDRGFTLTLKDGEEARCARLLLAPGGAPIGMRIARELGHTIVDPVPSLFTFTVPDSRLRGLAGLSVPHARLRLDGSRKTYEGPLLITHTGLSGPAVLRLSAFAARELAETKYKATLRIDWLPAVGEEATRAMLMDAKRDRGARQVANTPESMPLPRRLWTRMLHSAGVSTDLRWGELPGAGLHNIVQQLKQGRYPVTGKSTFKEEFVTCGGVSLKEVDFRTMQSRKVPGLFFAGEVLDIDGVTGGYNFQNAWTTGLIAGECIAEAP